MVNLGCQLDLRSTKTPLGESVRKIPGEGLTEVGAQCEQNLLKVAQI